MLPMVGILLNHGNLMTSKVARWANRNNVQPDVTVIVVGILVILFGIIVVFYP